MKKFLIGVLILSGLCAKAFEVNNFTREITAVGKCEKSKLYFYDSGGLT